MSQAALYGEPFIYLIPKRKKKTSVKECFFHLPDNALNLATHET